MKDPHPMAILFVIVPIIAALVVGMGKLNSVLADFGINRQGVVVTLSAADRQLMTEIRDALREMKR